MRLGHTPGCLCKILGKKYFSVKVILTPCFFFCHEQAGENVEPLQVPSHAVFQPPRKQVEAIKDNPNFLGKSKVQV